jgi:hypothetical protein
VLFRAFLAVASRQPRAQKGAVMHVNKAFERYLRHHRTEGSSPKTLEWHTYSLR